MPGKRYVTLNHTLLSLYALAHTNIFTQTMLSYQWLSMCRKGLARKRFHMFHYVANQTNTFAINKERHSYQSRTLPNLNVHLCTIALCLNRYTANHEDIYTRDAKGIKNL